jgi:hypothetical protein
MVVPGDVSLTAPPVPAVTSSFKAAMNSAVADLFPSIRTLQVGDVPVQAPPGDHCLKVEFVPGVAVSATGLDVTVFMHVPVVQVNPGAGLVDTMLPIAPPVVEIVVVTTALVEPVTEIVSVPPCAAWTVIVAVSELAMVEV